MGRLLSLGQQRRGSQGDKAGGRVTRLVARCCFCCARRVLEKSLVSAVLVA